MSEKERPVLKSGYGLEFKMNDESPPWGTNAVNGPDPEVATYPDVRSYRTPDRNCEFTDPPGMRTYEFYKGLRGNQNGTTLAEMLAYTPGEIEADHDYIQWMFPSNEPSNLNGDAPTMTKAEADAFAADEEAKARVLASFVLFLDFLGFEQVEEKGLVEVRDLEPTAARPNPRHWLDGFNHNMLRVTRILKCLRLTGLTPHALAFYDALRRHRLKVSPNTMGHWSRAAKEPLW